jgi:hypothetical protein
MTQPDAMFRRRAAAVGIMAPIGNHSFTGITAYLSNGGAHHQAL